MTHYLALLRAINVGGRNVKMEALRALFEGLGFRAVRTHLASGNVLFDSQSSARPALQTRIEQALLQGLGYSVDCFLRDPQEMLRCARRAAEAQARPGIVALNVGFLHAPPDAAQLALILAARSEIDDFEVHGREIYWGCARRQSESRFQPGQLERKLKQPITFRGVATTRQLADLLNAEP